MQCEIARRFFDMLHAVRTEQKASRLYCGKHLLYQAELDLLEKIDENPAVNISGLSERSGVTKSAVTQMSAKLLEKGLIERYQSPGNKKEKYFRLTQAGQAVRQAQTAQSQAAAETLRNYLCAMDGEKKKTILEFMEMMKTYAPFCAFPCRHMAAGESCIPAAKKEREKT